jgi:hypothetical protein
MFLSEPEIASLRPTLLSPRHNHRFGIMEDPGILPVVPMDYDELGIYSHLRNGCTSSMHDKLVVKIKGATVSFHLSNEFCHGDRAVFFAIMLCFFINLICVDCVICK